VVSVVAGARGEMVIKYGIWEVEVRNIDLSG
jgi:hypothetical protein